ncbi:MAG TPA: hypothetical protein VK177_04360 [Flavobacteriales bacterium]|nr:hypothetical protein [Flavobacteriales bacterium]
MASSIKTIALSTDNIRALNQRKKLNFIAIALINGVSLTVLTLFFLFYTKNNQAAKVTMYVIVPFSAISFTISLLVTIKRINLVLQSGVKYVELIKQHEIKEEKSHTTNSSEKAVTFTYFFIITQDQRKLRITPQQKEKALLQNEFIVEYTLADKIPVVDALYTNAEKIVVS